MADIYTPFLTALRAKIGAAWPEVVANGIYQDVQLARIPWEKKVEAGGLPMVYFEYDLRDDPGWGLVNRSPSGPVYIYYISSDATLIEPGILGGKLETLRALLWDDGLAGMGQVLTNPDLSIALALPPNAYFAQSDRPYWCGCLMFRVLIGETPS